MEQDLGEDRREWEQEHKGNLVLNQERQFIPNLYEGIRAYAGRDKFAGEGMEFSASLKISFFLETALSTIGMEKEGGLGLEENDESLG